MTNNPYNSANIMEIEMCTLWRVCNIQYTHFLEEHEVLVKAFAQEYDQNVLKKNN